MGRVAELAGVSVRTLHHYDEIGLVRPSARTGAGYRAYSAGDVERLREVLAYRRLGFGLREVAELVDDPSTDAVAHLYRLRGLLLERRDRADAMVTAIDREIEARAEGLMVTPEAQLEVLGARLYDAIGGAYPATRRTEPRIAARIWEALGNARTVLNVGAGTGSYEPADRDVTAVEPSAVMRGQRPAGSAPCVAAVAEGLPFEDDSFDVAMAVSTVHHWGDPTAGLREMRRVARRVVDPERQFAWRQLAGRHPGASARCSYAGFLSGRAACRVEDEARFVECRGKEAGDVVIRLRACACGRHPHGGTVETGYERSAGAGDDVGCTDAAHAPEVGMVCRASAAASVGITRP